MLQRCPHPRHRNHRRRLSVATDGTRSALAASHCGHGGITRRSLRCGLVGGAPRSRCLCMAPSSRGATLSRTGSTREPLSPAVEAMRCLPSIERTSRRSSGGEHLPSRAHPELDCTSSARSRTDAVSVRSASMTDVITDVTRRSTRQAERVPREKQDAPGGGG